MSATTEHETSLARLLRRRITAHGPLGVDEFMAECLGHPRHGYYMTADPIGAGGDFVTAPEISQMFGELIAAWCADVWRAAGAAEPVVLAELGPGRGTLMADLWRAAGAWPAFRSALRVHLVETSPVLRARQQECLAGAGLAPAWHDDFVGVAPGPLLVLANEFFDALPVHQFERTADGWRERLVDAKPGGLCFVLGTAPVDERVPAAVRDAPTGAIAEVRPAAAALAGAIGRRLAESGGAALIIDYGHAASAAGDTLQAVRGHAWAQVLAAPGEADLTAHVDFAALASAARSTGARVHGPVPQGRFLECLGIAARAEALCAGATPAQAADVAVARRRLTAADAMGTLFKVLAVTAPGAPTPPGFA